MLVLVFSKQTTFLSSNAKTNDMADLYGRRKFISTITKTAGTTMIVTLPDISLAQELSQANAAFIVQQVINIILKEIPNPF